MELQQDQKEKRNEVIMMTKDFIYIIAPPMIKAWEDHHLSAALSICQGIIESASGEHTCTDIYTKQTGNNLFGLTWDPKYTKDWPFNYCNTKEWDGIQYVNKVRKFMRFKNWDESIEYHTSLLLKSRYAPVVVSPNWWSATKAIKDCGYATSPTYTDTLRYTILKQELYKYDFIGNPLMDITKNFKWGEFFSTVKYKGKEYKRVVEPTDQEKNIVDGAKELQKLRDVVGRLFISSGYRIPEYNSSLPTASKDSYHLIGQAFDIVPLDYPDINYLYNIARQVTNFKGFGIYKSWLHLDSRKELTIWKG